MTVHLTGTGQIDTVDDAIAETLHLTAVAKVVDDRLKALKVYVGAKLGRPGTTAKVDGIGKALLTDPKLRPVVTDDDAFRAWALEAHPDRTGMVDRLAARPIEEALAGHLGDDLAGRLAAILDEIPGAVTSDVVIDANLVEQVAKPAQVRELDDGRLVSRETGEWIPGVALELASKPSPRVTPDPDALAALIDEITGRLPGLPTLGAGR